MTLAEAKKTVKAALAGKDFDVSSLVKVLNLAKKVYYHGNNNEDLGLSDKAFDWFETSITDKVFDTLEDVLRGKRPKSSYFKNNIGAPVSNASGRKVKLPVPMASLDKIKPDSKNLSKFIKTGPFVISAKVDGVSLLIQTKGKKLYTRGNGEVGQDISHMWDALRLPKSPKGDYTLRAEMVISKSAFEKYRSDFSTPKREAKNARNSMSGLVNSGSASKALKHADVLCYAVIGKKPSDAFVLAEKLGFDTPFWKAVKTLDPDTLNYYLKKVKANNHEADGLVVSKDLKEIPTRSNPVNTVAYKNNELADTKEFLVKAVLWAPSKHGLLKPVLALSPQELDGVTISKCTAFNGKYVYDNKLGPKARVKLVRSGGVIPHVLEVTKQASRPQMPEDFVWKGADTALPDVSSNSTVTIKKISYFFRYLGAEGVSTKLFQKMYEGGYTELKDILTITKRQLMALPGVQEKSASTIYNQIQKTKEATLLDYMAASGCFPSTVASTRIGNVLAKFPDILTSKQKEMTLHVASLPGFSTITTKDFVEGAIRFKGWYKDLKGIIRVKAVASKARAKSSKLKDLYVVPTGFRFDAVTKNYIEEHGGTIQNSMSKETTLVVTKDSNSSSSKVDRAASKGIKIMPLNSFKKMLQNK